MIKSIENIVFQNYIKYERLAELINYAYAGSSATEINIYIDLYPIIRSIYSDTYNVSYNGFMDLVPLLINMCAHYRFFFKRSYGVHAKIYLVAGRNMPEYVSMLVPEYNFVMQRRNNGPAHSVMDDMIKTNFDIMKILAPYLPDVHFVDTAFETSLAIGYIISKQTDLSVPNLVISKDIYGIQLVTSNRFPNTSFIMPFKKSEGETNTDVSVIIKSMDNPADWHEFWEFYITHRKLKFLPATMINPSNLSPIISLSGLPERTLKTLMQFPSVYCMIEQIIGSASTQCSIESIYSNFDIDGKVPRHIVENRFHCIDLIYQLDTLYSSSTEAILLKFENKHDPQTVKKICDKYFVNIPINLDKL